ncbi:MAG: hypothetical protein ACNA8W_15655 [Bradymonadaceae bacterium]
MNLRNWNAEEMTAASAVLLDPAGDFLSIMEGNDMLAGPVTVIHKAHHRLLTIQKTAGSNDQAIRALTIKMTRLDALHDRKGRGAFRALEAAEDLADTPEIAEMYAGLRELTHPKGLGITQRNYREQAGTAKRVQQLLTPEARAQLEAIKIGDKSLLVEVDGWLETALLIGRHEAERARLSAADSEDAVTAGEVRDARIYWIQAINALLTMIPFAELDDNDRRALLANLEDADKKARRRARPGGRAARAARARR